MPTLVAPTAPTITNQTAIQTWTVGKTVNFTLAANTFTDPQGENLTYSVSSPTVQPCRPGCISTGRLTPLRERCRKARRA